MRIQVITDRGEVETGALHFRNEEESVEFAKTIAKFVPDRSQAIRLIRSCTCCSITDANKLVSNATMA